MKDRKKTILIILLIIFISIAFLVIFINLKIDNSNQNSQNNNNVMNNMSFNKVNNYNEFFSIQNTLNANSALNKSYIITELYLSKINDTLYYFINSDSFESDMVLETINYQQNNFCILVVNNGYYELSEIKEDVNDLMIYAKMYKVEEKEIKSGKKIETGITNNEKIISIYLTYFKDILVSDSKQAYEMLTDDAKNKYGSYSNFYNQIVNIYNNISTRAFAYSKKQENNKNVYYIEDEKRNKIVLYEEDIMKFKILF